MDLWNDYSFGSSGRKKGTDLIFLLIIIGGVAFILFGGLNISSFASSTLSSFFPFLLLLIGIIFLIRIAGSIQEKSSFNDFWSDEYKIDQDFGDMSDKLGDINNSLNDLEKDIENSISSEKQQTTSNSNETPEESKKRTLPSLERKKKYIQKIKDAISDLTKISTNLVEEKIALKNRLMKKQIPLEINIGGFKMSDKIQSLLSTLEKMELIIQAISNERTSYEKVEQNLVAHKDSLRNKRKDLSIAFQNMLEDHKKFVLKAQQAEIDYFNKIKDDTNTSLNTFLKGFDSGKEETTRDEVNSIFIHLKQIRDDLVKPKIQLLEKESKLRQLFVDYTNYFVKLFKELDESIKRKDKDAMRHTILKFKVMLDNEINNNIAPVINDVKTRIPTLDDIKRGIDTNLTSTGKGYQSNLNRYLELLKIIEGISSGKDDNLERLARTHQKGIAKILQIINNMSGIKKLNMKIFKRKKLREIKRRSVDMITRFEKKIKLHVSRWEYFIASTKTLYKDFTSVMSPSFFLSKKEKQYLKNNQGDLFILGNTDEWKSMKKVNIFNPFLASIPAVVKKVPDEPKKKQWVILVEDFRKDISSIIKQEINSITNNTSKEIARLAKINPSLRQNAA